MSRVFLFDIDGTLLNSGRAGQAAMEDALRVEFGVTEMDCDISYAGRTDSAIVQDLFAWFELPADPATFERFQQRYFSLLPTHLADRNGKVLPGVTRLLEHLNADSNDWTGLLTGNFERSGWMKVRHFAIDHHFSFGAFGDHHTNRDDVARLAENAARDRHGSQIETIWVIGDTPADITCARAIGARVLAVATGHYNLEELTAHQPDLAVEDLSDLNQICAELLESV